MFHEEENLLKRSNKKVKRQKDPPDLESNGDLDLGKEDNISAKNQAPKASWFDTLLGVNEEKMEDAAAGADKTEEAKIWKAVSDQEDDPEDNEKFPRILLSAEEKRRLWKAWKKSLHQ